jgi:hypothetical protein
LVAATLVSPRQAPDPSQPAGLTTATIGQVDAMPTARVTLRAAPTPSAVVVQAPSPAAPKPTPTQGPTPTPKPTPRFVLDSDLVSIRSRREVFRGAAGTYTWSSLSISPDEIRVAWVAKAGRTACRVRWALDPEADDSVGGTIKVASGDEVTGARRIDTSSITGAALTVTSTCPIWRLAVNEAPKPTPRPAAAGTNCHPSYAGACLKDGAGDYDCAGGSGNGPNYVYGTVRVVGWDEFGLDGDNDGYGCE